MQERARLRAMRRYGRSPVARKRAPAPSQLRMPRHRCALSFRCDAGDTRRSFLRSTVACFLIGAASVLRNSRDSMQRFDPYRMHLSVLAVAIAACSPAVQAQTVGVSSDAVGLASPIRPDTASSNEGQRPTETASVAEHPSDTASTTSRNDAAGREAPAAAGPESGVKTLDAMQVTGVRRANAAAVESKRAATNITDVISATDVRALPDSTIVEALRRVPGLSVLPATDNEHPRDEAATPVLRGLGPSYNNVTIDGSPSPRPAHRTARSVRSRAACAWTCCRPRWSANCRWSRPSPPTWIPTPPAVRST